MMRALFAVSGLLAVLISIGALVVHENSMTPTPLSTKAERSQANQPQEAAENPEIRRVAAISEEASENETANSAWGYDDTCPGDPRLLEIPGTEEHSGEELIEAPEDRLAMVDPVFDPSRSRPSLSLGEEEAEDHTTGETPTHEENAATEEVSEQPAGIAENSTQESATHADRPDPLDELFVESVEAITPVEPSEPEFSPEMIALRERIRDNLDWYYYHPENTGQRSCWGIMHSFIAYGADTYIEVGGRGGNAVNGIGWLCWNQPCNNMRIFYISNNSLAVREGPGYQGHAGQLLALLAQCRVSRDYVLKVGDREFTVEDLIEYEKATCEPNSELTFKLIGLMHYLDSDATWRDNRGRQWDMQRLIREELAQPVVGAACGGTHRMMGFSYAVRLRRVRGEAFEGQWERARKFVEDYHTYTMGTLRNEDGSFSTEWFEGRGADPDTDRRLQTSGHILEWLVYSLPAEELQSPEIVQSVDYLTKLMYENRGRAWEIGPKGHALHALLMYDRRVFGGSDRQELSPALMAERVEEPRRQSPQPTSSGSSNSGNSGGSYRLFRRSR